MVIFFFAILIIGHEFGHFLAARLVKIEVEEFGIGFPPRIFGKKFGKTLYSINWIPFGGFVKIPSLGADLDPKKKNTIAPAWKRAIVFISGVLFNFLIGWVAFSAVYSMGSPVGVYISRIVPDSPAAVAGFKSGDLLKDFSVSEDFITFVKQSPGKNISVKIDRSGAEKIISVSPKMNPEGIPQIGAEIIDGGFERQPLFQALISGFNDAVSVCGRIFTALLSMFRYFDFSASVGPVALVSAISNANHLGLSRYLDLLGLVSLNLAILNILPIPALDGGHLIFLAIEKIRRKPLALNRQMAINGLFFLLLLALMFFVTIKDVITLF